MPPSCTSKDQTPAAAAAAAVEEEEAALALAEIIEEEFGATKHESSHIAHNCPKYLSMLLQDALPLKDNNNHNIKDKLKYVATLKGDKGMVPFLESIGLRLPYAIHLARSLSHPHSHNHNALPLPLLILKVKYVKELFFSNSSTSIGSRDQDANDGQKMTRFAQRMMMHLSISVDDDLQHTLSFFEKIEARRGGLNMLASADSSLSSLIESFPRILLLPLDSCIVSTVKFLENMGISKEDVGSILLLYPPIIFYDVEKVLKPRIQALEKVGANKRDLNRMLIKYPWILSTAIQENYGQILSFFELEKVPIARVGHAIKSWPILLGCSVSKLKLMVKTFDELGVSNKTLGKVISASPQLLLRKPREFLEVVSLLKDLGLDKEAICRALGRCPELFATSIDRTLEKKLSFLASIGVYKSNLPRIIRKYPEFFVCDVERALLPRMKYLVKSGLSRRDVASMVRRFSPLLGYSIAQVLKPKLEFLVNTMEKPLKDVVEYPRYFSYSLERKIKPRFWVLKSSNIECSLKDMLAKNDEEFAADFMMLQPPISSSSTEENIV